MVDIFSPGVHPCAPYLIVHVACSLVRSSLWRNAAPFSASASPILIQEAAGRSGNTGALVGDSAQPSEQGSTTSQSPPHGYKRGAPQTAAVGREISWPLSPCPTVKPAPLPKDMRLVVASCNQD